MSIIATAAVAAQHRLDLADTTQFPYLAPAPAAGNMHTDRDPKVAAAARFLADGQAILDRLAELGAHGVLRQLAELPPLALYECAAGAVR